MQVSTLGIDLAKMFSNFMALIIQGKPYCESD